MLEKVLEKLGVAVRKLTNNLPTYKRNSAVNQSIQILYLSVSWRGIDRPHRGFLEYKKAKLM